MFSADLSINSQHKVTTKTDNYNGTCRIGHFHTFVTYIVFNKDIS